MASSSSSSESKFKDWESIQSRASRTVRFIYHYAHDDLLRYEEAQRETIREAGTDADKAIDEVIRHTLGLERDVELFASGDRQTSIDLPQMAEKSSSSNQENSSSRKEESSERTDELVMLEKGSMPSIETKDTILPLQQKKEAYWAILKREMRDLEDRGISAYSFTCTRRYEFMSLYEGLFSSFNTGINQNLLNPNAFTNLPKKKADTLGRVEQTFKRLNEELDNHKPKLQIGFPEWQKEREKQMFKVFQDGWDQMPDDRESTRSSVLSRLWR